MAVVKDIFRILKNGIWDEHHFRTSADQVFYTKEDGTASNVQKELAAQNSTMIKSEEISYQDVLADVNQPVLLKDFSIDSKWKTRKIIGILPVNIRGYDTSLFIPSIYRQYSKAFFTSNIKQSYDITINVLYK